MNTLTQLLSGRYGLAFTLSLSLFLTIVAAIVGGAGHAPRLGLIWTSPSAIQIHLGAAAATFVIGAVLMVGPKGTLPHKQLGWTWAATMGTTALSSFFIQDLNPGGFSFIHAISGWVLVALPAGLYAARRHKVRAHRNSMIGMYVGGMFFAGAFAFTPGRLLYAVFF